GVLRVDVEVGDAAGHVRRPDRAPLEGGEGGGVEWGSELRGERRGGEG
ncbi:MAG: hypothetical protein AVDCRST_MAG40-3335, partial [uncultured Gemmatimonadaceae bacterium]